jgi:hypothetical protein
MPPTRQAHGYSYRSPPIRDVYGPGAQNKWIAWNNYYYVYNDEHLQWVLDLIDRFEKRHMAGGMAQIAAEDVWLCLGGFSALVEVFKKTKNKFFRPWIQGYLDAWENFQVFKHMRDQLNFDFQAPLYVDPRDSPKIVAFLDLASVLLLDPEPVSSHEI